MNMGDVRQIKKVDHEVNAVVHVPGSKSIANRALICAALAVGESELIGIPDGDDTEAMIEGLITLGARIKKTENTVYVRSGIDLARKQSANINARLAGTTARFLSAVCALVEGRTSVSGEDSLLSRPMNDLHQALLTLGAQIEWHSERGRLPATFSRGTTTGSAVSLPADISSQFTSALLLISPALANGLAISTVGEVISQPYITMSQLVMRSFGAHVDAKGGVITVAQGGYCGTTFTVEPDASSASYPLAAAAIVGGSVSVPGLGQDSIQGDAQFARLLGRMGCDVAYTAHSVSVMRNRNAELQGIDVDMRDMSDLVPTLAAVAVFAATPTTIRGVGFIRSKESNRIDDLVAELQAIGADATATTDGLIVRPASIRGGVVQTHHDHRMAMAFALIGIGVGEIAISQPLVVNKSWPGFWSMLEGL